MIRKKEKQHPIVGKTTKFCLAQLSAQAEGGTPEAELLKMKSRLNVATSTTSPFRLKIRVLSA